MKYTHEQLKKLVFPTAYIRKMPYPPEVIDEMLRLRRKALVAAYYRQYRQENAEQMSAYQRQRYEENAEEFREYSRQRYQENPDYFREYSRQFRQENPVKYLEYSRKYRDRNPDKLRAHNAATYAKKVGIIPHVEHCQHCFEKAEKLEMHHPNLDYPESDDLNIVHLCVSCHRREHSRINDEMRQIA